MAKTYIKIDTKNSKLVSKKKGLKYGERVISATSRTSDTCAPDCPFLESNNHPEDTSGKPICYPTARVGGGPSIFMRAEQHGSEDTRAEMMELKRAPDNSIVRHLVSGDVASKNDDYLDSVRELSEARPDLKQYGYTHHWRNLNPSDAKGMVLNASTETAGQAKEAIEKGWQAVIESPKGESLAGTRIAGRKVVSCPNQKRPDEIGCADCHLCRTNSPTRPIVEFEIHGATKKVGGKVMAAREAEQKAITTSGTPDGDSTDRDISTFLGMPAMPSRTQGLKSGWSDGRN